MSTSANSEGIVVMHHVIPQNNQPMESQEVQRNNGQSGVPKSLMKFFQGEPEVLGVTQLFVGLNHIFFGIILTVSCHQKQYYYHDILVNSGVLFWSGILYVISGSLSISASHKPSIGKVTASLVLNIISCVSVMVSVILFSSFFIFALHFSYYYSGEHCAYYGKSTTCEGTFFPRVLHVGIAFTLLLFTALELCIALSTSIFGCKTVCRTSYSDVTVVIYQTNSMNNSTPASSSDGQIGIR